MGILTAKSPLVERLAQRLINWEAMATVNDGGPRRG